MKLVDLRFALAIVIVLLSVSAGNALFISTVPIGDPDNAADTRYIDAQHLNGVGSVAYAFRMGQTEVTNLQYMALLNSVARTDPYELYDSSMANDFRGGIVRSGSRGTYTYALKAPALDGAYTYDNKPVIFVTWGDALRFANWLHNGQPVGLQDASTTEDGAYLLNGAESASALSLVNRKPGTRWWLPSEDEWYKSAYYDSSAGIYYDYPTGANTVPNNNPPSADTGNSANYFSNVYATGDAYFPLTDAGAYVHSGSPYGTLDQGGSVFEFNERIFSGTHAMRRGGAYDQSTSEAMKASDWGSTNIEFKKPVVGFRVASIAIPEPSTTLLCIIAFIAFPTRRR